MTDISPSQINAANRLNDFLQFAAADKTDNTIVHFNTRSDSFSVATRDRIKGFTTWWAPHRDIEANKDTRTAFKEALFKLFNAEKFEELPTAVRRVLKEGDFDDSGKPLSVRRIKAVMTAVAETPDFQKTEAFAKYSNFMKANTAVKPDPHVGAVTIAGLKSDMQDFLNTITTSARSNGGNLLNVVDLIVGENHSRNIRHDIISFTTPLSLALGFPNGRIASPGVEPEDCPHLNMAGDSTPAIDQHLETCKANIRQHLKNDAPELDDNTRQEMLNHLFGELDKIADFVKVRLATLANLNITPGETTEEKVKNFERYVNYRTSKASPTNMALDCTQKALALIDKFGLTTDHANLMMLMHKPSDVDKVNAKLSAIKQLCGDNVRLFKGLSALNIRNPKVLELAQKLVAKFKEDPVPFPTNGTGVENYKTFLRNLTAKIFPTIVAEVADDKKWASEETLGLSKAFTLILTFEGEAAVSGAVKDLEREVQVEVARNLDANRNTISRDFDVKMMFLEKLLDTDPEMKKEETKQAFSVAEQAKNKLFEANLQHFLMMAIDFINDDLANNLY